MLDLNIKEASEIIHFTIMIFWYRIIYYLLVYKSSLREKRNIAKEKKRKMDNYWENISFLQERVKMINEIRYDFVKKEVLRMKNKQEKESN